MLFTVVKGEYEIRAVPREHWKKKREREREGGDQRPVLFDVSWWVEINFNWIDYKLPAEELCSRRWNVVDCVPPMVDGSHRASIIWAFRDLADSRNLPVMKFQDFVFMYSTCERRSLSAMNVFNQGTIDPLILLKDCFSELSTIKPFNWKALPSVRLSRNLLFSVSIFR